MREIKFRAWEIDDKKMCLVFGQGTKEVIAIGVNEAIKRYLEDDNWAIMQFTGLKDRYEKEIYEGDVLKLTCSWKTSGESINIVEYKEEKYGGHRLNFKFVKGNKEIWDEDVCPITGWIEKYCTIEIIGNKYENPELSFNKEKVKE